MKRFARKTLAVLATLALAAPTLADDVTLRFSWWGGGERHENTLKVIQQFEAKNPGVKIKAEYMGFQGYLERLTTQIAGGAEPDIMQINWAWMSMFSKRGDGFYDLNQQKAKLKLADFSAEELKMGTVENRLNALPVGFTARVFLWNKSTWDKAGLPLPKTWDELFAAGPIFKAKLGDKAYPIDGEAYDMILTTHAYVYQKYGTAYINPALPKIDMTRQAILDWVKTYKRLQDDHVAVPLPLRASMGGAEKPTEQQPEWVNGNWAGNYAWDSTLRLRESTLPKDAKTDIGDFLSVAKPRNSGMFGRPSLMFAVSKNSKNPALAAQFLNYLMTDPEAGKTMGLARGIPASQTHYELLLKDKRFQDNELKAFNQIKQKKDAGLITLPSPLFENARMQKFLREVFEQVAYGKATPEQAASRLEMEGAALLNRIK